MEGSICCLKRINSNRSGMDLFIELVLNIHPTIFLSNRNSIRKTSTMGWNDITLAKPIHHRLTSFSMLAWVLDGVYLMALFHASLSCTRPGKIHRDSSDINVKYIGYKCDFLLKWFNMTSGRIKLQPQDLSPNFLSLRMFLF